MKRFLQILMLVAALFVPWAMQAQVTVISPSQPYINNFDDGNSGFTMISGDRANAWVIGSATSNSGSNSLYVSNDGGTTNAYTNNNAGFVYAVMPFTVNQAGQLNLSYSWKCKGENNYDYFRVFVAPGDAVITAGTTAPNGTTSSSTFKTQDITGWISVGSYSTPQGTVAWESKTETFYLNETGNYQLVFMWANDGSAGNNPPAAIDDLSLTMPSCGTPGNLACSGLTNTTATVSWTPGSASQNNFVVAYGTGTDPDQMATVNATSASATITGLTANTSYNVFVKAICSATDESNWSAVCSIRTLCNPVAVPYTEDFESYTAGTSATAASFPECWTYTMNGSGSYTTGNYVPFVYNSSTYAQSGTKSLRLYGISYTCLPPMSVPLDSLQISFWNYTSSTYYGLEVGVMEGSTFVPIQDVSPAASSTHYQSTVYFNNYTGTSRTIAFRNYYTTSTATQYSYAYIDDIEVTYIPTCVPVSNVAASDATVSGATVSWTPSSASQTAFEVAYGTANDLASMTVAAVNADSIVLTGLNAATTYYVKVRGICSATDTSEWSGDYSFRTTYAVPFLEDFEASSALPTTWFKGSGLLSSVLSGTAITSGGSWGLKTTAEGIPAKHAYNNVYGSSRKDWLITPSIYLNINTNLSFDLALTAYNSSSPAATTGTDDKFAVVISTDNGSSWSTLALWDNAGSDRVYNNIATTGQEIVLPLSAYTGQSVKIGFYVESTVSNADNNLHLDNVLIEGIVNCVKPTAVTAELLNASSALVTWTGSSDSYIVKYGENDSITVTDTAATITGLAPETTYSITVRGICGTAMSNWSNPATVFTGYCQPAPTSVDGQGITLVTFGTNGEVVNNTNRPTSSPYYGNYYQQVGMVPAGTQANVDITLATGYSYGTVIWVDWNNNLTFDGNEVVYVGEAPSANPTTLNASFIIPAGQDTGYYRMRIAAADSYYDNYTNSIADAAGANPCPASSYTIVHDYTLHVGTMPSCLTPVNVTASSITANTATISWEGTANSYIVKYGDNDSVTANDTTVTLTGLTANTTYNVYVKAVCSATDQSSWSVPATFQTLCEAFVVDATNSIVQDFENGMNCWTAIAGNAENTANSYYGIRTSSVHGGSHSYMMNSYSYSGYDAQYLVSPEINATSPLEMTFWYQISEYGIGFDHLYVAYSTTTSDLTAMSQWIEVDTSRVWVADTMSFPANTKYIAFKYDGDYAYYIYLDDIDIHAAAAPAPDSTTFVLSVNDTVMGTTVPAPGTYQVAVGDTAFAQAVASTGYHFVGWNMAGVVDTNNPVSFVVTEAMANDTMYVQAAFEADGPLTYTLNTTRSIVENFEGDNALELINGDRANGWYIGSATSNGGTHSLYVSNDGGTTNAYTNNNAGFTYAVMPFTATEAGQVVMNYDWKCKGENNYDYFRVFVAPGDAVITAGTAAPNGATSSSTFKTQDITGWISVGTYSAPQTTVAWETKTELFNLTDTGSYQLVFMWANDGSAGNNPPAAIDNISLVMPSCPSASNVVCTGLTNTTATVSWTPGSASQNNFVVAYGTGTDPDQMATVNATSNNATLTGLTANTTYNVFVKAICSATDQSGWSSMATIHTLCNAVAVPYTEDFESYTAGTSATAASFPECWTYTMNGTGSYATGSYVPFVYSGSTYAHSGTKSLRLYGISYTCLPPMSVPLDSLRLTFWNYTSSTSYGLEVGVMEDNTFVPIQDVSPAAASTHYQTTVFFANYTGTSRTIAFRNYYTTSTTTQYSYAYIDDIEVTMAPTCIEVSNVAASDVTATDATISWTPATASQNNFVVAYGTSTSPDSMATVNATADSVVLTGLTANTVYNVYVKAVCSATDQSAWSDMYTFRTNVDCGTGFAYRYDVIGNGTTTGYTPFAYAYGSTNASYANGISGYIFTAAELADMNLYENNLLHGFKVHAAGTGSLDLTVFVAHTDKAEIASTSDTFVYDNMTQVFNGTANFTAGEWTGFMFNQPFAYDADSNLAIVIRRNAPATVNIPVYYTSTSSTYRAYYDYKSADAAGFGTCNRTYYRPNMGFVFCTEVPNCVPVSNVTVSNVTANAATVSWTPGSASQNNFVVAYGEGTDPDQMATVNATATSANLTGLTAATAYNVFVKAVCSATDQSAWSTMSSFTTECNAFTLPFVETFEEDSPSIICWSNEGDNEWTVGTGDHDIATGAQSGTRNAKITHSSTNATTALISPVLQAQGQDTAMLSFYYINRSWSGDIDQLSVFYRTDLTSDSAWIQLGQAITGAHSTWTNAQFTIPLTAAGTLQVAFQCVDHYGYGIGVDSVFVDYYVADTTAPIVCDPVQLPFACGFEATDNLDCWSMYDADNDGYTWDNTSISGASYSHSGSGVMTSASYINGIGALTPDNWLVTPAIVLPAGSTPTLSWYAKGVDQTYCSEHYTVYVSTTGNTPADFTTALMADTATASWIHRTADLTSYAGQTVYIAFRHHNTTDEYMLALDDVTISATAPQAVVITAVANDTTLGAVTGSGNYMQGDQAVLTATAAVNCRFAGWNDGNTANPRTVSVDSNATYTAIFEMLGGDTLYYDNGNFASAVGFGNNTSTMYWAVKFNGAVQDSSKMLTKVQVYDYLAGNYTVNVYQGGTTAPDSLMATQNFTLTGAAAFATINLNTPVATSTTQPMWIVVSNTDATYPAAYANYAGTPDGSYISLDGTSWMALSDAITSNGSFMVRGIYEVVSALYHINAVANDSTMGTVTGGGNYVSGNTATLTAIPYHGYEFVSWSDSNTNNPRTIVVTDTATYTAIFAPINCTPVQLPFTCGFEATDNLDCWNWYDADNDGYTWDNASIMSTADIAHNGSGVMASASYINNAGALTPDNWLVTPAIALPAVGIPTLSWYVKGVDQTYCSEHYTVYVSTTGNTPADFTTALMADTATASWVNRTVDLTSYAGQTVYIAFRHHNTTDEYWLAIDDIDIHAVVPPTPDSATIVLTVNDTLMGNTTPAPGTYVAAVGDTVSAEAVANYGYHFAGWVMGSMTDSTNPANMVVTQAMANDTTYIQATFAINQYTIQASANDASMGTVTGAGIYNHNDTATLRAIPANGCHFVSWNDNDTNATRVITVISDSSFVATFAYDSVPPVTADSVIVILDVNDAAMGTTDPVAGTYVFHYGETAAAQAIPANGYHFVNWTIAGVNEVITDNPVSVTIDSTMLNMTFHITANFAADSLAPNQHTVTVIVMDTLGNENVGGMVDGFGVYTEGDQVTLTATADSNYTFLAWYDAAGAVISWNNPYTFTMGEEDVVIYAKFANNNVEVVDPVMAREYTIYSVNNSIVVRGAEQLPVYVYDVVGRLVATAANATAEQSFTVSHSGVYLVKVANSAAKRVVVR